MLRALPLALLSVLVLSLPAFAQDDDDLAPIAPVKKAPPPAKKAPPKVAPPKKAPPAVKAKPEDDDDLAPIAAVKGDVTVKLTQTLSNAILSVDGKDVGPIAGTVTQTLSVGEHTLKVRRLGYADFVKKVTIAGGKPVELEAKLQAINAIVSVTSDVADAQVLVNGRLVGNTPVTELELPAGPTEIAVRKDGFKDDKQRLTLVAGKDYPLTVKFNPGTTTTLVAETDRPVDTRLTPDDATTGGPMVSTTAEETPITGRWYFWAGIAAVAVGAAVATGVVVANNNQPIQRLDEKALCAAAGGKCDICVGLQCSALRLPAGAVSF